jgi:hypothetical protein
VKGLSSQCIQCIRNLYGECVSRYFLWEERVWKSSYSAVRNCKENPCIIYRKCSSSTTNICQSITCSKCIRQCCSSTCSICQLHVPSLKIKKKKKKMEPVSQISNLENVPFNHSAMSRIGSSGPIPNPGPRSNFGIFNSQPPALAFFFQPFTRSLSVCGLRRIEGALYTLESVNVFRLRNRQIIGTVAGARQVVST